MTTSLSVATTPAELDAVLAASTRAAQRLREIPDAERATWLEAIADALDAARDELVELAVTETRLPVPRLTGEVTRTTNQLRAFAAVVRDGSYLEAVLDSADPSSTPPRPDIRRILIPLGPVANFAASNFPFAFSVAGGDTASALAAGCPVVVKAHPGHPELSRRTAELVLEALDGAGAPEGTFALVEGTETGAALVAHPAIAAGAFTGSTRGGRALFDIAVGRPDPIPFYGELGSVNPVVVTEGAVRERGETLVDGLVASFTFSAGQLCTKPGLVFAPASAGLGEKVLAALGTPGSAPLLNDGIASGYRSGWDALRSAADVRVLSDSQIDEDGTATPGLAVVPAAAIAQHPELADEVFGPATLIAEYESLDELPELIRSIGGSLTGTVHAVDGDEIAPVVSALEDIAGRVLFGGWPTGVAVTWSQQHGGPWPSSTSIFTSVGMTALRRFQRPLAYQDAPATVLPAALRDDNPLGIPRRIDGVAVAAHGA
ncbi:MAG: aldehyde dehydrogenase (NADP(+)) [Microbacteriaceae bacterium]